jgi:hypothetical protein
VACGADATGPDLESVSGDYVLRTVNGGNLPITVLTEVNLKLEIAAETLFIKSGGAFSDVTHYIRTDSVGLVDRPADTLGGTWSLDKNVVNFSTSKGPFIGTIGGAAIVIEGNGLSFRYIK